MGQIKKNGSQKNFVIAIISAFVFACFISLLPGQLYSMELVGFKVEGVGLVATFLISFAGLFWLFYSALNKGRQTEIQEKESKHRMKVEKIRVGEPLRAEQRETYQKHSTNVKSICNCFREIASIDNQNKIELSLNCEDCSIEGSNITYNVAFNHFSRVKSKYKELEELVKKYNEDIRRFNDELKSTLTKEIEDAFSDILLKYEYNEEFIEYETILDFLWRSLFSLEEEIFPVGFDIDIYKDFKTVKSNKIISYDFYSIKREGFNAIVFGIFKQDNIEGAETKIGKIMNEIIVNKFYKPGKEMANTEKKIKAKLVDLKECIIHELNKIGDSAEIEGECSFCPNYKEGNKELFSVNFYIEGRNIRGKFTGLPKRDIKLTELELTYSDIHKTQSKIHKQHTKFSHVIKLSETETDIPLQLLDMELVGATPFINIKLEYLDKNEYLDAVGSVRWYKSEA